MTERVEEEAELQREELILKEQELSNLLHQKNYVRAVGVAISLGQPFRVLNILQGQHSNIIKSGVMLCVRMHFSFKLIGVLISFSF